MTDEEKLDELTDIIFVAQKTLDLDNGPFATGLIRILAMIIHQTVDAHNQNKAIDTLPSMIRDDIEVMREYDKSRKEMN